MVLITFLFEIECKFLGLDLGRLSLKSQRHHLYKSQKLKRSYFCYAGKSDLRSDPEATKNFEAKITAGWFMLFN